jgi:hypothetical protein
MVKLMICSKEDLAFLPLFLVVISIIVTAALIVHYA